MKVAHCLTVSRILLTPPIVLIYLHPTWIGVSFQWQWPLILFLFTLSELSDACDGYFARKLGQVTDLGALFDPLADSLSRLAIFFAMTRGEIGIFIEWPLLMLCRELGVSTLRTLCALQGFALSARLSGKLKSLLQSAAIFAIFIAWALFHANYLNAGDLSAFANTLVAICALFSLLTGLEYLISHWSRLQS